MKILIVEDDDKMCKIINLYLQKEGYEVAIVNDGLSAISYVENHHVDLVLLDWMLPYKNGIEVCQEIKAINNKIKIIIMTAKSTINNELVGLSSGANDYIRKPFDMKVLLLRIKNLCDLNEELKYKEIVLNNNNHSVHKNNKPILLTKKEYLLLHYLLQNKDIVLTREQILYHVWGFDYNGEERTVDTHIRRLRKKIGNEYIKTKIGIGYIMGDDYE